MGTEFKCAYCNAAVEKNATLVHTERGPQQWELDCCMCPDCFKQFKGMLEKVKRQKSWTGWAEREQEAKSLKEDVKSLKKDVESLNSELQFLRKGDPTCLLNDAQHEVVTVVANGCDQIKAHRSILMTRSEVFKKKLTSEEFRMTGSDTWMRRRAPNEVTSTYVLPIPMHKESFEAFIQFLYTAELEPEILKDHASELMKAGDQYEIPILKRKCEDYIVKNVTLENAIAYLELADQCKSKAITKAAVKQMQTNPSVIMRSEEFKAMKKTNSAALAGVVEYLMLETPGAGRKKESSSPQVADTSVPGSDPAVRLESNSYGYLGTCNCSVHPFAHSRYGYH